MTIALKDQTVEVLKQKAKSKGLKGCSKMNKAELVSVLSRKKYGGEDEIIGYIYKLIKKGPDFTLIEKGSDDYGNLLIVIKFDEEYKKYDTYFFNVHTKELSNYRINMSELYKYFEPASDDDLNNVENLLKKLNLKEEEIVLIKDRNRDIFKNPSTDQSSNKNNNQNNPTIDTNALFNKINKATEKKNDMINTQKEKVNQHIQEELEKRKLFPTTGGRKSVPKKKLVAKHKK